MSDDINTEMRKQWESAHILFGKGWLNDNSMSIHWTDTCIVRSKQYELHLQFVSTRPTLFFLELFSSSLQFLCVFLHAWAKKGFRLFQCNKAVQHSENVYAAVVHLITARSHSMCRLNLLCIAFQVPSDFGNQIGKSQKNYPFVACAHKNKAPETVSLLTV